TFRGREWKLETASEFRVEGYAEGQTDVVLGGAAEAGDEVISLEYADRNGFRSVPVISTAKGRGKGVVGNRYVGSKNVGANAVMGESEQPVYEERAILFCHLHFRTKHVGVDFVLGARLALVAAIDVGGQAEHRRHAVGCFALPTILVDGIRALSG